MRVVELGVGRKLVDERHGLLCFHSDLCCQTPLSFARFDYDAYGTIRNQQIIDTELIDEELAQSIVDTQPLRYAGYVWDPEASLYYCSQRYYDPTIAAFISKDPIKADGELSAYSYYAGDPIMNVDPSGLCYWVGTGANRRWAHDSWEFTYGMKPLPPPAKPYAFVPTGSSTKVGGGLAGALGLPSPSPGGISRYIPPPPPKICNACGKNLDECSRARQDTMLISSANNATVLERRPDGIAVLSTSTSLPISGSNYVDTYSFSLVSVNWGAGISASAISTSRGVGVMGTNGLVAEWGYTIDIVSAGKGPYVYLTQDLSGNRIGVGAEASRGPAYGSIVTPVAVGVYGNWYP